MVRRALLLCVAPSRAVRDGARRLGRRLSAPDAGFLVEDGAAYDDLPLELDRALHAIEAGGDLLVYIAAGVERGAPGAVLASPTRPVAFDEIRSAVVGVGARRVMLVLDGALPPGDHAFDAADIAAQIARAIAPKKSSVTTLVALSRGEPALVGLLVDAIDEVTAPVFARRAYQELREDPRLHEHVAALFFAPATDDFALLIPRW